MINNSELERFTNAVCQIARQAGAYIREERSKFSLDRVERKHAHDYVSYVDKGSEQLIDQYAPYAVSIALLQGKEVLIGVVYEICSDECFYAWKDGGAYVNGRQLHVSTQQLEDALLCLQLPYNSDAYKPTIKRLIDQLYGHVGSIRACGSAAIALCHVAAGRLDGYAEQYIGQWDYMAGSLIVKEAGGIVTDYSGSADFTQGNSVVATNGIIQQALLDHINK